MGSAPVVVKFHWLLPLFTTIPLASVRLLRMLRVPISDRSLPRVTLSSVLVAVIFVMPPATVDIVPFEKVPPFSVNVAPFPVPSTVTVALPIFKVPPDSVKIPVNVEFSLKVSEPLLSVRSPS